MVLPPLEDGERGMTRRHILVERNRRRQEQFAPIRDAMAQEELRLAQERHEEKERLAREWRDRRGQISMHRPNRPLPGGGPRSERRLETETQRNPMTYKQEKQEAKDKKSAYQKLYEEDMRQQLADRKAAIQKQEADDQAQLAALREIHEEQGRMYAEEDLRKEREQKEYTERLVKTNIRELERKRELQRQQYMQDEEMKRLVAERNRHQAESDERRKQNAVKVLQLLNEEARIEALKNRRDSDVKNARELEMLMERDRRLAKEDQEAEEAKKARFRQEFEDCVRRDREFRRIHNYDEPIELTRMKNEQAAASHQLLLQEEALRNEENRRQYKKELLKQIKTKQEYELKHFGDM
eukprot:gene11042-7675_t